MKKPKKKKASKPIQSYAFIDTNIFLDFYRSNNEANITLFNKLTQAKDRIICTYQVEMEFLKHRQETILTSLKDLSADIDTSIPAVVADESILSSMNKLKKEAKKKKQRIEKRVLSILSYPKDDRIYSVLADIFSSKSRYVLKRDMPERQTIKRLARKRFLLGYPPRKQRDTSIGDAINWEWFIHCASFLSGRFIIVSRDSDYGCEQLGKYFLNDQLKQEFRDRVGQKSIVYTKKLSDALKSLEINVTQKEMKAEEDTLRITVGEDITLSDIQDVAVKYRQIQEVWKRYGEHISDILDDSTEGSS
jgi:hypothetical protein